ncbi:MAG: autotransporter domain-containing protein [Devosia ginsengisoli]|nr:autotransporter domain-containing protein [Devosia ginsengisoli]
MLGTRSAAINFTGGNNRLELRTGYGFNGAIIANGVLDTLALGGATDDTFDVTQILTGQIFQDFEQLEKVGANIWTLTGDGSGFGGQTNVVEGTLLVNGSLGGTLDVLDGGRLGGSGTLGAGVGSLVTIANGGTLAPGNSIGTIVVDGDLVFDAGSIFEAEIDPALAADLVDVSGTVTINGGTVHALKAGGVYTPDSRWTIIDAAGGVTGTFDALSQNMPFVDLALAYDANAVFIDATRNSTSFCDVAETLNQCETGNGLEPSGPGNPVYDAVAALPDEDSARDALDALSGEIHGSGQTALIEDSRFVREAMNNRLRSAFGQPGASYAPVLAYGPGGTPMAVAADDSGPVVWGHGFGSWSSTDSDGNAASFGRSIGGLLIGTDGLVGDWRIGLLAGYSRSGFNVDDRASSGSSDSYHVGLYGGTEWGDLAFRTGAAYTWHNIETERSVAMPGFSDTLHGVYNAGTFQAFGELAYGFELGNGTRFEPFANLAHVSLHTGSFSETGGAAALSGPGSNADVTFTTLGLRAEHTLALGTVDATLRGMVGWKHAFGEVTPDSTHAFASGDAFTIAGAPIAKDAAVIEAGLDLNFTPEATFGLSYSGQIAGSAQDHGFKANLTVKF